MASLLTPQPEFEEVDYAYQDTGFREEPEFADFPHKLAFLFEPKRYKILYGGRLGLKSWSIARALLTIGAQRPVRVLCARETMESIQQSVHQLLKDQIAALGLQGYYDVTQNSIRGRFNDTLFTFAGLAHNVHNIKSLESYDILWVEEAQNVSKDSWETIIPTIRKAGSEIWVSFNPRLSSDDTYIRFVLKPPPNSIVIKTSWQDNPWISEDSMNDLNHLRETDPVAYQNVYEGECRSSVEGAIFPEEIKAATNEGRICVVPYNRARPVDTIWDLGFGDFTSVWFCQSYDNYFHFIDYLEGSGKTIEKYIIELQNKGYLYGKDWLPFDGVDTIIHKKLAGDRKMSIEMLMRDAGRNVRIVPKVLISDRINAARTIFPQCKFDADKCAAGLDALRFFQWGPLNKDGGRKRDPLHNWASHASEAFTRAGQVLRQPKNEDTIRKNPVVQRVMPKTYSPFGG